MSNTNPHLTDSRAADSDSDDPACYLCGLPISLAEGPAFYPCRHKYIHESCFRLYLFHLPSSSAPTCPVCNMVYDAVLRATLTINEPELFALESSTLAEHHHHNHNHNHVEETLEEHYSSLEALEDHICIENPETVETCNICRRSVPASEGPTFWPCGHKHVHDECFWRHLDTMSKSSGRRCPVCGSVYEAILRASVVWNLACEPEAEVAVKGWEG